MIKTLEELTGSAPDYYKTDERIPYYYHLFSAEELGHRAELMAVLELRPGQMVKEHMHQEDSEAYYILEGRAMVVEDGAEREMKAGEAEFCCDGHTHGIRNHTDGPMRFLAIILPNRAGR